MKIILFVILSTLLGALIGGAAGLATSSFTPVGALGGIAIGALIGAYFGMRMQAYRAARRNPAVTAHTAQQREAQSRTLRQFSPTNNRGDSIKVGSIHGEMDRFKDGTSPN